MSDQRPVPAASNTFERIKRTNERGGEFWSARELARVLEYSDFRNFITVITKAREACTKSGHAVSDHFVDITEMVDIGSGAQRGLEDWALSRYACYLVIQNADWARRFWGVALSPASGSPSETEARSHGHLEQPAEPFQFTSNLFLQV